MNLDPNTALAVLEQQIRASRQPRVDREEAPQALRKAVDRAELAAANFSRCASDDPDKRHPHGQRIGMITLARGTLPRPQEQ